MASAALRTIVGMLVLVQLCEAAVYKVGDSAGWTTQGDIDYKHWAETKTFEIGDVIVFEYNPEFHDVLQVMHAEYRTCNASAPLATYTSGNDSITITKKGHHLFICGFPGHCQAGQKVDINVLRSPAPAAPAPSAAPSAPAPSAAPSPNGASSLKFGLSSNVAFAVFVMVLFA